MVISRSGYLNAEVYRAPAEWERHRCTWLAWPHNPDTFPEPILWRVEQIYCEMIREISRGEAVKILVNDEAEEKRAERLLDQAGVNLSLIEFHHVVTVDVWVRDYAPIFVERIGQGILCGIKWRFNAWGMKYADLALDDAAGREILRISGAMPVERGVVVEGGAIDLSGDGLLITTKECLLNPARNPGVSLEEVEAELKSFLGVEKVLWLERGVVGDDTDGHVDVFCRFVAHDTLLLLKERREGVNRDILEKAAQRIEDFSFKSQRRLEVHRVPAPAPVKVMGQYVPASYLNFYISNSSVLVPLFGVPEDEEALATLEESFHHRRVIGIRCPELFYGLGGIHCVTMQQPETNSG
ncbi:MAG: agmatine deiminase family protein [Nitrososphaerota archaeon]